MMKKKDTFNFTMPAKLSRDEEENTTSSEYSSGASETESDDGGNTLAYQNGSKKTSLAIRKDGMAVCEHCGNIGVKHAFYSKTKQYCSMVCARAAPKQTGGKTSSPQIKNVKKSSPAQSTPLPPKETFVQKFSSTVITTIKKTRPELIGSFDWRTYLSKPEFQAAPVSCFSHVALADCWDNITVGMKVEVENKDCDNFGDIFPSFYWIATVIKIAGYMAQLRYEGFGTDCSNDFWVNLCTESIHPVGWCASQGKPLIPPKSIEYKYSDWKLFLVKRLTGARTLPVNFHLKVEESLRNKFQIGMKLEVVDKNRISAVRVARVFEVVGGRLHVSYETTEEIDDGFWCHERSPLIHPIGWAQVMGHDLKASQEYAKKSLHKALLRKFDADDSTWDMFHPVRNPVCNQKFKEGMKLEAIDPLNLSTICVATVTRVLRNNYLMIGIDGMMAANGSDWFCYHASSPCIFPVGFCELNGIDLTPPRGYKGEFKWFDYLRVTKSLAAPVSLFTKDIPNHGFKEGMHVEAVDLMEPRLICVGSITKVVGRLLRVHFDGWDDAYDQWCDCESPDLFPVGWCEVVGYRLEAPRAQGPEFVKKKKFRKYRGPRKKKKSKMGCNPKKGLTYSKVNHSSEGLNESIAQDADDTVSSTSDISGMMKIADDKAISSLETNKMTVLKRSEVKSPGPVSSFTSVHSGLNPCEWGVLDVAQFLRINECGAYSQIFSQEKVDGKKFLSMSKEEIMSLTGMKVGPSLKIFDILQKLKMEIKKNPS